MDLPLPEILDLDSPREAPVGVEAERLHLPLPGLDGHGGDKAHPVPDEVHDVLGVGHAADEEDGVHLALQHRGEGSDVLRDLVAHGLQHLGVLLVPGQGLSLDGDHVHLSEVAHEPRLAVDLADHGLVVVLAGEAEVHQGTHRHAVAAVVAEGPVPGDAVLGVHHLALAVGGDGDAAAESHHQQVQVLIAPSDALSVGPGHGPVVEGLVGRDPGHIREAGVEGQGIKLTGPRHVHGEGRGLGARRHVIGDLAAQGAGVDAVLAGPDLSEHVLVDAVGAALHRRGGPTPGDDGVQLRNGDAVLGQEILNVPAAEAVLGKDAVGVLQILQGVGDGLLQKAGLVLVVGDLGGGGPKIDGENVQRRQAPSRPGAGGLYDVF